MPTYSGTRVTAPSTGTVTPSTINYKQQFCTVQDLIADLPSPGSDMTRMYQAICEASDYLQKEIGWFVPVTLTRKFNGKNLPCLHVPPLLAISSIVNDDDTLTTSDYILKPEGGAWGNGPYIEIYPDPDSTTLVYWYNEIDHVVVTGRWGLYERSGDTGATVQNSPEQSSTQGTLKVSDGSKVSPGMVLLIGTEQQAVTGWSDPTAAVTTLNGAVAAGDETVTFVNGALINVGEVFRVGFEKMKLIDKQTHQGAVIRGWDGTGRVAHLTGSAVDIYRTITVERGVNGTTGAAHAISTTISRYFMPDDIQYLAKQIATLIVNKAKSGYQGRTGNAETGVIFYNDAFPKFDIERIKQNYYIPGFS
jgi:hypothetical protein